MNRVAVAYVPVLHQGYVDFIERNIPGGDLFVIPKDMVPGYRPIEKDIRALGTEEIAKAIEALALCRVLTLTDHRARGLASNGFEIVLPDEDVSRIVAETYFARNPIYYDTVFLRWDKRNSVAMSEPDPDRVIEPGDPEYEMLMEAIGEGYKSSDWWRRVGSVIVGPGYKLAEHNHHLPSLHAPYFDGDPRANFNKGVHLELTTAIHAEAACIAKAARLGLRTEGAIQLVTDFPCPPCAKLIAAAQIRTLYYLGSYAVLDGEKVLDDAAVQKVRVAIK